MQRWAKAVTISMPCVFVNCEERVELRNKQNTPVKIILWWFVHASYFLAVSSYLESVKTLKLSDCSKHSGVCWIYIFFELVCVPPSEISIWILLKCKKQTCESFLLCKSPYLPFPHSSGQFLHLYGNFFRLSHDNNAFFYSIPISKKRKARWI